jgi:hypothetical protein
MSGGTRAAVARAAAAEGSEGYVVFEADEIAAIEHRLLSLTGKANQSERNRLNKRLWILQQPQQQQRPQQQQAVPQGLPPAQVTAAERLSAHWRVLRPDALPVVPFCARCGDGSASACSFHPDAKAYAFGTGRFDYAYTSLWDTPHDGFMCCGGVVGSVGCCVEQTHTADAEWWRVYAHLAPALPSAEQGSSGSDEDSAESGTEDSEPERDVAGALEAMDIG